jgi:uncharacterized protein (TIGR03067 family)
MRKTLGTLAVLFLAVFAVQGQDADAVKKELAKLEGDWKFVRIEGGNEKSTEDQVKDYKITFKGNTFSATLGVGAVEGTIKIDPGKKPKTMDLAFKAGPDKDKVQQAIYSLDGDELKVFAQAAGKDRPKDFDPKDKTGYTLFVLKRAKP